MEIQRALRMKVRELRMKELRRNLKVKVRALRKFQKGIAKNYRSRRKCNAELRESMLSFKELDLLKEDAIVYKLVGPMLVKQDPGGPNANVRQRIRDLAVELKRIVATIWDLEKKKMSERVGISTVKRALEIWRRRA